MSRERSNRPSNIVAEAADWHTRMRSGEVLEIDAARFRAWIGSHPEHRREFKEMDALWEELGALAHAPEVLRERNRPWGDDANETTNLSMRERRPTTTFKWALAASVLLVVTAIAWMSLRPSGYYTTGIGEQRVIPLEDGSIITLNTSSELRVNYSAAQRTVQLLSGQANFEVAKDSRRPFIVRAGDGVVRAVGTIFDVNETPNKITVTLLEGSVAVFPVRGAAESKVLLAAGEQLSYANGAAVSRPVIADIARVSAWRTRKLDFSDTRLSEAIAEANRYSKLKIELQAPGLLNAKISGTFEAGKSEALAEGLETYFHLRAAREGDRIVLRPDP